MEDIDDLILSLSLDLKQAKKDLAQFYKDIKQESKNVVISPIMDATSLADYDRKLKQSTVQAKTDLTQLQLQREKASKETIAQLERELSESKKLAREKKKISDDEKTAEQQAIAQKNYNNKLSQQYQIKLDREALAEKKRLNAQAIAEEKKLANEKQKAYDKSFMGAITGGTSFGHKVATTAQYATAGAGIYAVASALNGLQSAIVTTDSAMTKFNAILGMSKSEAKQLEDGVIDLAQQFGGNIDQMNNAALALGRAGLANQELAEGLKVANQMAIVSGDSIDNITEMLASWKTVYPKENLTHLGDVMTKVANESLASVEGIKTATSYVLSMGQQAGLTAESIISVIGATKNLGKADSIVGTETRRLFEHMIGGTDDVKKAYGSLGVDIEKVGQLLANAGTKAEKEGVMLSFYKKLGQASKEQVELVKKQVPQILDLQTLMTQITIGQTQQYEKMIGFTKDVDGELNKASESMATSYEQMMNRIKASFIEGATVLEETFKESSGLSSMTAEELSSKMESIEKVITSVSEAIGASFGLLAKVLIPIIENIDKVIFAIATYKTTMLLASAQALTMNGALFTTGIMMGTLRVAVARLTATMMANPLFMVGAMVGAIGYTIWDAHTDKINKTKEAVELLNKKIEESNKWLKEVSPDSVYDRTKQQIKEQSGIVNDMYKNLGDIKNVPKSDRTKLAVWEQVKLNDYDRENAKLKALIEAKRLWDIENKKTKGKPIDVGGNPTVGPKDGELNREREVADAKSKYEILNKQLQTIKDIDRTTLKLTESEQQSLDDLQAKLDTAKAELANAEKYGDTKTKELEKARANVKVVESEIQLRQQKISLSEKDVKQEIKSEKDLLGIMKKQAELQIDEVKREEALYKVELERIKNEKTKYNGDNDKIKELELEEELLTRNYNNRVKLREQERALELSTLNRTMEGRAETYRLQYQREYDLLIQAGYSKENAEALARERSKSEWDNYVDSLKDGYGGLQSVAMNAFSNIEDAMVEATKTGKLNFKNMANAIMEDLLRLTIKMQITSNLAQALGMGSGFTGGVPQSNTPIVQQPASFNPKVVFTGGISNGVGIERFSTGYLAGNGYSSVDSLSNDTIPAMISKGEAVIPASVVNKNRGLIEALISSRTNKFATGYIGSSSGSSGKSDVKVEVVNKGSQQIQANDVKITQSEQSGMIVSIIVDDIRRGGAVAQAIRS